jgi:hypothetical protein
MIQQVIVPLQGIGKSLFGKTYFPQIEFLV